MNLPPVAVARQKCHRPKSVSSPCSRRQWPCRQNCPAASVRCASPRYARGSTGSCSSACSAKAVTSRPAIPFLIDAATYQAALDSAQANLGRAQANLSQVTSIAERYKPLVSVNAVSQLDYSNAVSNQKLAEADVASAKAALATSRINLEYATVRAPISGRIGQALVTEGALVSQAEATQMALIQQIGSVYVNFTQSSGDLLRLRKAMASNQLRGAGKDGTTVHIALEDGSDLPRTGRLLFSDLNVDPTSGQVTLRAEVPNLDGCCCRGSMYGCVWPSPNCPRRCCCHSRPLPARTRATRCWWSAPTACPPSARSSSVAIRTTSGSCSTASSPANRSSLKVSRR